MRRVFDPRKEVAEFRRLFDTLTAGGLSAAGAREIARNAIEADRDARARGYSGPAIYRNANHVRTMIAAGRGA